MTGNGVSETGEDDLHRRARDQIQPWAAAARTRGRPFVSQFTFFKKVPELKLPLPTDICTYMRTKITAISELI